MNSITKMFFSRSGVAFQMRVWQVSNSVQTSKYCFACCVKVTFTIYLTIIFFNVSYLHSRSQRKIVLELFIRIRKTVFFFFIRVTLATSQAKTTHVNWSNAMERRLNLEFKHLVLRSSKMICLIQCPYTSHLTLKSFRFSMFKIQLSVRIKWENVCNSTRQFSATQM